MCGCSFRQDRLHRDEKAAGRKSVARAPSAGVSPAGRRTQWRVLRAEIAGIRSPRPGAATLHFRPELASSAGAGGISRRIKFLPPPRGLELLYCRLTRDSVPFCQLPIPPIANCQLSFPGFAVTTAVSCLAGAWSQGNVDPGPDG